MVQFLVSYAPGVTIDQNTGEAKDNCDLADQLVEGLVEGRSVHYPDTFVVQVVDRPELTESEAKSE